jgi:aerobic-type carbon monoxide dehydrogenase small subunit (CoxS/CutS family)
LTQTIELDVNGAHKVVTADPGTPLIYVLRNDLKLKGTRFGCGAGVCGCCTVLLDGRGIQSCNTPLSAAAGRKVTTIEGLGGEGPDGDGLRGEGPRGEGPRGEDPRGEGQRGQGLGGKATLHPLQQAFIDEQAGQCGYCLTGIIMGAVALLGRTPSPTEAQIRSELDIHLCRCGAYDRILRAIRRASETIGASEMMGKRGG